MVPPKKPSTRRPPARRKVPKGTVRQAPKPYGRRAEPRLRSDEQPEAAPSQDRPTKAQPKPAQAQRKPESAQRKPESAQRKPESTQRKPESAQRKPPRAVEAALRDIAAEDLLPAIVQSGPDDATGQPARPLRPSRCGHVTLTGQPNVGKSTLLNRLVGEKLAIVSPKPQTTRDQIRGIWTGPDTQVIFLDTPGIHRARSPLNRAMVGLAIEALESVDVVVLVVDAPLAARHAERIAQRDARVARQIEAAAGPDGLAPLPVADAKALDARLDRAEAEDAAEAAEPVDDERAAKATFTALDPRLPAGDRRVIHNILRYNKKWMVALNKIDLVRPRHLLPVMQALSTSPGVGPIVPISAETGDGVAALLEAIRGFLPEAEPEYAADELTDRSLRFLCAELVREQVFLQTRDEVPYGVACEIEVFDELKDLTHIQALVHVEKPAQRGILIGKGGARMKELASQARLQMEQLLGRKVFLEVHVRVEPEWTERTQMLKQFGYVL